MTFSVYFCQGIIIIVNISKGESTLINLHKGCCQLGENERFLKDTILKLGERDCLLCNIVLSWGNTFFLKGSFTRSLII